MDKKTFIDKIKLLFSEVESESEKVEHSDCECKGEEGCECDKYAEEEAPEVEAPEKKECECEEGDEDCKCDEEPKEEVVEAEMAEETEEVDPLEARFLALETSLANISESMSAIDSLSKAVSELANSPAEEEVKLSKASVKGAKSLSARDEKLIALSKRK